MEIFEKLQKKYSLEEIAESYVFPHGLTPEEERESNELLRAARLEALRKMTPEERFAAYLLGLRYRLEDVLKLNGKSPYRYTFQSALREYQESSERKPAQLATELALSTRQLNQLMKGEKAPDAALFYRLEAHSDGKVTALQWSRLVAQQWENELSNDHAAREREASKVKKSPVQQTKAA